MGIEYNELDDSFNTRIRDSFNTSSSTNTTNLAVDLENVGNTDASTNNSDNTDVTVDDSFHEGSHNQEWDIEDSGNTDSYNTTIDITDASQNDHSDHSVDDHSINAGNRSYDTGFRDLNLGGAGAAGAGSVEIDNRSTIVDQSTNSNIEAEGSVFQLAENEAVVASGDGAIAAGDDVDITNTLDASTTITAGEDVNIGNETTITTISGSFNVETDNSSYVDNSVDVDVDDSFNDYSETVTVENSFNEELTSVEVSEWDIDANVIWSSDDAIIVEDAEVDLPPL